ncbi:MAG: tetratricopeptide repeat protein [Pirellulales bacterium]
MARIRKAGGWLLIAALSTAPSTGCKNGFSIPVWNPFAKKSSGSILERDSSGGYIQPPSTTMPDPGPPIPKAEEFGFKSSMKKLGDTLSSPFKKTAADKKPKSVEQVEVELASKEAPPSATLFVSLAKLQEKAGKNDSAVTEYEKALEADPKHLPALLGLARLYDRMGEYDDAVATYKKAVVAHPESAAAFNDLGLCYARANRLTESVTALQRAVAIDGDKPLYRNNLATVLIETGRPDEAYRVLVKAHGEAVAHYNVGFILNKRGQKERALQEFKLAAKADPNLQPAKHWIKLLEGAAPPTTSRDPVAAATQKINSSNAAAAPSPAVVADPSLETPIPTPIVVSESAGPRIAPISQPRVVEEPAEQEIRELPPASAATESSPLQTLPTVEPAPPRKPMPSAAEPTDAKPVDAEATGPKLLGNEQARRNVAPTIGDRYYVGDRYSTPVAQPQPSTTAAAPQAGTKSQAPLPENTKAPTTVGARYGASRF